MGKRSHSQFSAYTRCSEQYRLNRTLDLPWKPAAWTAVGSAFHTAYEIWELGDRQGSLSALFKYSYEEEIASLTRDQPDLTKWIKTPRVKSTERDIELRGAAGEKQAEAYEESCRSSNFVLANLDGERALELPFEIDLGSARVRGKIDCVLDWGPQREAGSLAQSQNLTLRDLKTGNKGDHPDNRQLGLYSLALNELYGLNITYGEYWYTKLGASGGWVDLSRYTRPLLEDYYGKLDLAIEKEIYLPNPGKQCTFCDVKNFCREFSSE